VAERTSAPGSGKRARASGEEARRAGRPPRGGRAAKGRGAKGSRASRTSGRYTAPIPKEVRRSPRWYPWMLLALLLVGILCIILNYIDVLPASPTNWYVVGGLVAILASALLATRYR